VPVQAADDLYGLPLEAFVPERTILVKQLRAGKKRAEATEVAALKKPSVAAWAVNQLVRTQRKAITGLFDAGDAMADAAAAGRDGAAKLREATTALRDALGELTGKAEGLLNSDGQALGPATIERVTETLRAAALDLDARERVEGGRLIRELQYAGLGLAAGASMTEPLVEPARRAAPEPTQAPTPERPDTAAEQAEEQRRHSAELKAAQESVATARDEAYRAFAQQGEALHDCEEATSALERTERRLEAAEEAAARAAAELAAAEQRLSQLEEL
jgi:hypothetical protein